MIKYTNIKEHPLYQEQLNKENAYKEFAEELMQQLVEKRKMGGEASSLPLGNKLIDYCFDEAVLGICEFVSSAALPKRGVRASYLRVLREIINLYNNDFARVSALFAVFTLSGLIDSFMIKKNNLSSIAYTSIGKPLKEEIEADMFISSLDSSASGKIVAGISKRVGEEYKREYINARMRGAEYQKVTSGWPRKDLTALGTALIDIICKTTNYFEIVEGEVHPTLIFLDGWQRNEKAMIHRSFRNCPTIIPPAPWNDLSGGGYYGALRKNTSLLRSEVVKHRDRDWETAIYAACLDHADLSDVMEAINAIQETPWRINSEVVQVLKAVIDSKGGWAGIPAIEPLPRLHELPKGTYTEEDLKRHKEKAVERVHQETVRKSKAFRILGTIRTAEEFSKYDAIYFPHNMDFRGRVYAISNFGPQGDDVNKGLLLFADVPPVKSWDDIKWLKIHGANLAGIDKVSFAEREQWIDDHEAQIIESAKDPLNYRWWAEQDDSSWQLLAFCFEWKRFKEYLQDHNDDPSGFVTGLVISFDGTCSGLQHFSAILRDPIGGSEVNLVPGPKPNDIYQTVADKVNEILKQDAVNGSPDEEVTTKEGNKYLKYGTKSLAQQWFAFGVTRKVTKKPVMTLAYGATEYGYRGQIYEDTIKPAKDEGKGGVFVAPFQAARYLAKLIWETVQIVVVKAAECMRWLRKVARIRCKKKGRPVSWFTPMGLPVQQGYVKTKENDFNLRISGKFYRLYTHEPTREMNTRVQIARVAPNFIHSMDAAHLQATVLKAKNAGIRHYAMIHDSYGAPLAQAGLMFRTVREAFKEQYDKQDILGEFIKDQIDSIGEKAEYPAPPKAGTLDIRQVLDSQYMFA